MAALQASTDGRWAGSLSSDIDQLLLRQVAGHLDSQRVVLAPATVGFTPDVQVLLTITRLDSGESQPAILDAQWRLIDRRGQVRDNRIVHLQEQHAGGTAAAGSGSGCVAADVWPNSCRWRSATGQSATDCRSTTKAGSQACGTGGRAGETAEDPDGCADSDGYGSVPVLRPGWIQNKARIDAGFVVSAGWRSVVLLTASSRASPLLQ